MTHFELVRLVPSGDVIAFRIDNSGDVTSCGPLHHTEQNADLRDLNYDDEQDASAYARAWDNGEFALIRQETAS